MQKQFFRWPISRSILLRLVAGISMWMFCRGANALTVIDHRTGFDGLSYPTDISGFGQTFIAKESFLQDAAFVVTSSPDSRVWWSNAHIQLFHGLPPGTIGATAPNLLYTSPTINFGSLPQTGSFGWNSPLYQLSFSQTGLNTLLPLIPGDTYTMTVSDFGTSGNAFYAANQPSFYPDGGDILHTRNGTSWSGPFSFEDLAFEVVMVPEPECITLLCFMLACLALFAGARRIKVPRPLNVLKGDVRRGIP